MFKRGLDSADEILEFDVEKIQDLMRNVYKFDKEILQLFSGKYV